MGRKRLLLGGIALILVAIVVGCRSRGDRDVVVTDGSYLGLEIGSPKAEVFAGIEAMVKDDAFGSFRDQRGYRLSPPQ